ncbi:DNAJ domain-containing [Fusarium albosuccineum]|uniref:DNAJ domain-containing n=1 Tax=Fusarium albosuccineum TaxID=1237068 RepID=A0A8H4PK35_9HYPO|nr:DNAJ domain-containing [Fusarium albosuccineum]
MESIESAALESRHCQFRVVVGSSDLGQPHDEDASFECFCDDDDTETRTKVTHIERFGNGIIGTVLSLTYGTWQGQPAALLVLLFSLRGREDGYLRFRAAEFSISFKSRAPDDSYPVVRSIQPGTKRVSETTASSLWPRDRFAIRGSLWSEKSQPEPHQVLWKVKSPREGICDSIPVATILTFSSPFIAIVKAKAMTGAPILTLRAFPWSRNDPVLFDGVTPKGKGVASTDFSRLGDSGLEEIISDYLSPSSTQEHFSVSSTAGSSTATEKGIISAVERKPNKSESSRQVYRVHGIPISCSSDNLIRLLSLALSVPDVTIQVKAFSSHSQLEENVAVISFESDPPELKLSSPSCHWHFAVPAQRWLLSQEPWALENGAYSAPIEKRNVDLHFDTNFYGFTQIGMNLDPRLSANIDIIAIHGLGGHAFGSFKQRNGHYMWLQETLESDLISSQEFGQRIQPRILVYGYNARVDKSQSFQSMEDLAIELRMQLRGIRERDPSRPLIFIGHSLGGLLVKELLIQCAEPEANTTESAILKATRGALFFGVPNKGMDVTALLSIIGNQPNSEFLTSLGVDSPVLNKQAQLFPECFQSPQAVIYSFYETCVSNTAERVNGKLSLTGDPVVLVDKQSATHSRPWEMNKHVIIPIQRPHADLVKFEKYSPDYEKIRNCIREILGRQFGRRQSSNGS